MRAQYRHAVETALQCLALLGIEIPAHPTQEQFEAEYEKIWQALGERMTENVADLPLITDPERQAAMQVLAETGAPAQNTDINLHYLTIFRLVNLSFRYGTTDASTHGYASVAIILGPVLHPTVSGGSPVA